MELTLANGARIAQKGEFTKRAFLNKKIDLSQAEAVLDIIHAKTENFAQKSANNLSGSLTNAIKEIKSIFQSGILLLALNIWKHQYTFLKDLTRLTIKAITAERNFVLHFNIHNTYNNEYKEYKPKCKHAYLGCHICFIYFCMIIIT